MSKRKLTLDSASLATLLAAVLMAVAGEASAAVTINPNIPIPGVKCAAGTTQITDTVARLDAICTVPQAVWKDVICAPLPPGAPCEGPPVVGPVIPKPHQIPVPTDDPKGPGDLCLLFCGDPPPGGPTFEECLTNPNLAYCKTDPTDPPTIPDPDGPVIKVDDKTKDDDDKGPPKGYHCDPRVWTSNDLVVAASITLPGGTEPINAYVLNSDFPKVLLPPGDSTQVPALPSFLSTATGTVDFNGKSTPYWLDDPRGDSSAYINPDDQGCVSVPNTVPTQLSADGLSPSADADTKPGQVIVTWPSWTSPDGVITIEDVAVDGGSSISGYVVHAYDAATKADTGLTCKADGQDATGCSFPLKTATTAGLTLGTNYIFKVAAKNEVGEGPLSGATDPSVAPQALTRKGKLAKAILPARAAARKKVTAPGAPTGVTIIQCNNAVAPCPSDQAVIVRWQAPKANGGKPISGYHATLRQVDRLSKHVGELNKSCDVGGGVAQCVFGGLRRNYYDTMYASVQAKNAKGAGPIGKTYKGFVIQCGETIVGTPRAYEQAKCMYIISVKVIVRITGRDVQSGIKNRIGCQLSPFIARVIVKMSNPAYPSVPGQAPRLTLGEAMNGICRISFTQIKKPVLNRAQKALQKKGYSVVQLKVNGLPSKGSRERPIGLPWAITRVENKTAIPINGGRDPRNGLPMKMGDGKCLQNLKVVADGSGVVTWIGVVKKKGYFPITGGWPFYKSGKTFFVFPKSKATKVPRTPAC